MVEARVRFFGPVRGLVGTREQVLHVEEGTTVRGLLEELRRSSSPAFRRHLVFEGNAVNPALLVALNGQHLDEFGGLDAPLPAGAVLDVMLAMPIAGA